MRFVWGIVAGVIAAQIQFAPAIGAEIQDRSAVQATRESDSSWRRDRRVKPRSPRSLEADELITPEACNSVVFPRHPLCPAILVFWSGFPY
jgi:hypothetical protein